MRCSPSPPDAAAQFPHDDGWLGLAAVGANGDLVGRDLAELTVETASDYRATLDQASLLAGLPTAHGSVPLVLTGSVAAQPGAAPPPKQGLVVAVNGTVAGVVGDYRPAGRGWTFTWATLPISTATALTRSRVYEVERTAAGTILHPAT